MVKRAIKFTPEVLLSTPRRSAGQPSASGQYVLHTLQTYSFEEQKQNKELRVLEADKGFSHLVVADGKFSEALWLPYDQILYLRDEGDGTSGKTELVVTDISGIVRSIVGTVDGAIADVKIKQLRSGNIGFVAWGRADQHGNLVNEKQAQKPAHTSMLFDNLMVRHWDTYKNRYHNSLFYGVLGKDYITGWRLKSFDSLLAGTKLECPIPPYPSSDFYDLSETGVIFVAKDPELNDATHTKSDLYFIPTPADALITNFGQQPPLKLLTNEIKGAASSPVFAPDGRSAAFLKMTEDGYEADRNLVIYAPDISGACLYTSSGDCSVVCLENCNKHQAARQIKFLGIGPASEPWDISPSKLKFGNNSNDLFLIAEQEAVASLFHVDVPTGALEKLDFKETWLRSLSDITPLSKPERLFLSGSSLVDNSFYATVDLANPHEANLISSHSRNGQAYGLHRDQVESFYYESEGGRFVHALMMRPSDFDETKKYPLAMLIHGGPQAAWDESWSTRWNPAVWAEQGYIVIMPNITGSTGYGQEFVDAITDNWGGSPYEDVVKCWDYIEANRPYVDLDRAVAAGASYGGYMMYWIQGHPLGRKFKALIAHDGVFNAIGAQMSGDELWFPFHDFKGPLWEEDTRTNWEKYDPSAHTNAWDTPMLVIHNGKDYRLSIAEGLAAFNVLQVKGVPSRFLTAPDENHWTLKEENSKVWHTVVLNWANKYAGLPPYREVETEVIEPNEPFDA